MSTLVGSSGIITGELGSGPATVTGENYLNATDGVITASAVNLSGSNATGTLAAARFPALTGDVTTSAASLATTIATSAVTLAKMANIADQTMLGNNSGGNAAPLALSAAATKTVLSLGNVENTALSTGNSGSTSALKTTGASVNVSSAAPGVATNVLTLTDATHATWQAASGAAPGGANTAVQFNDANAFGGDASKLAFNKTTGRLDISGELHIGGDSYWGGKDFYDARNFTLYPLSSSHTFQVGKMVTAADGQDFTLTGQAGGDDTGGNGGEGGPTYIIGAQGGDCSTNGQRSGNGSDLNIRSGRGGNTANGATHGSSGNIDMRVGAVLSGASRNGKILIGNAGGTDYASAIQMGQNSTFSDISMIGPIHIGSPDKDLFFYKTAITTGVHATKVTASDYLLADTSAHDVVTFTPATQGNYLVNIYYRVITGATVTTIAITWADGSGSQTLTLVSAASKAVGSYVLASAFINSTAAAITVTATAGTANQVYVSADIAAAN